MICTTSFSPAKWATVKIVSYRRQPLSVVMRIADDFFSFSILFRRPAKARISVDISASASAMVSFELGPEKCSLTFYFAAFLFLLSLDRLPGALGALKRSF